ncbi:hypothetical protein TanjilG_11874 [Lupinus angustifolius]|uniref:Sugar phosphate transporter domain-containing protein n=1 Tax=Lupinus angustifolius TaxID=3871 RepID=A0A394DBG7_LUPAN|nr:hypothetical protein TanjilG_11874 [Lupinus angustifolius]
MLNFFNRKYLRKILKRKDSDAGEKGRALEDLRASLLNEFRSSEGAKRLQQRFCGPATALTFNFLVAVGIIFMNKMVFQTIKFKYPILLTLIHYLVSWFLMAVLKVLSFLPASPSSKSTPLSTLFTLGFVMSLSTGFANVSLKYNSIGFYQMAKIAVTPSIVLAEFVLYRKKVSLQKIEMFTVAFETLQVLALVMVSIGVAVATVTDLQFHFFGACVALAWIVPSAVNKILWSRLQQQENWTALSLMWKTTPITLVFLGAMLPFLDPPGVLLFDWNFRNTLVIFSSAVLGFLLQLSGALALGKYLRKILKRKDSDAGEKGRALEDLRASLLNEFRSSEGAKRLQQRFCGPATALTFNFLVAVGIIFMNKMVFQTIKFKYPILLTLIHYLVSWFLMAVLKVLSFLPASPSSKSTPLSTLFTLGFVMSLSTGFANVSLKYNSIGFYQMAKIAVTPSIVLAEFVLYRKKVSLQKIEMFTVAFETLQVLALVMVSIGVAVATVTDLQFHFFGACVALAWIVPSAVNKILWSRLQQQENWTALSLMWKTTPITLVFLGAMLPFLDPPGVLLFDWNFRNTLVIFSSAVLGFLLQLSGALALGATSAISHVVLGQFKTCILLLGNYYLFGSNPGKISIGGAFTAIAGTSVYTCLNLKQQSNKVSPKQPSILPKSKLSNENGSTHDGHYGAESV